jgi:DNA mismatch endonuclease (patch repair protein)
MTDIVPSHVRSRMMSRVRQKGTRPELRIRKIVSAIGVKYRLNVRTLPGQPDLANKRRRWAIFVNGCFWHGHKNCRKTRASDRYRIPANRPGFWDAKFRDNRSRDARNYVGLRKLGFRVLIIWECDLRNATELSERISRFVSTRPAIQETQ